MQLITVHKIVITAAIALSGLFSLWAAARFASERGSGSDLVIALAAVGVGAALALYLRRFNAKLRRALK